jgi:hypothetical protein
VITNADGQRHAQVTPGGSLKVTGITSNAGPTPGLPAGRR